MFFQVPGVDMSSPLDSGLQLQVLIKGLSPSRDDDLVQSKSHVLTLVPTGSNSKGSQVLESMAFRFHFHTCTII